MRTAVSLLMTLGVVGCSAPGTPDARRAEQIAPPPLEEHGDGQSSLDPWDELVDAGLRASWRGRLLTPDGREMHVGGDIIWKGIRRGVIEDGGFTLENTPPGRYVLEFVFLGSPELGDRVVTTKVALAPGEVRTSDLRLPAGSSLSGVMLRPDGGTFDNEPVKASPPGVQSERGIERGSVRVQTDGQGRFFFAHLAPGAWVLTYGGRSQHRSIKYTRLPVKTGDVDVRFQVLEEW